MKKSEGKASLGWQPAGCQQRPTAMPPVTCHKPSATVPHCNTHPSAKPTPTHLAIDDLDSNKPTRYEPSQQKSHVALLLRYRRIVVLTSNQRPWHRRHPSLLPLRHLRLPLAPPPHRFRTRQRPSLAGTHKHYNNSLIPKPSRLHKSKARYHLRLIWFFFCWLSQKGMCLIDACSLKLLPQNWHFTIPLFLACSNTLCSSLVGT